VRAGTTNGRRIVDDLSSTQTDSPVGRLTLVAGPRGLRALLWPDEREGRVRVGAVTGGGPAADAVLEQSRRQLDEYFAGHRTRFDLPLDPHGTPFRLQAWQALRAIPYGRTATYGEQAARLGDARKARAVGAANGRNPISIVVPCHRVVGSSGALTGFAGGLDTKSWLLAHERAHAAG